MRQWCADRYEHYPITPEDMNAYYNRFIDGQNSLALTLVDGKEIVGYITLRIPAVDTTERRLGLLLLMIQSEAEDWENPLSAWRLIMLSVNWKQQKYRWEYLKTIRQLSGAMNLLDFVVLSSKKLRVTSVLAKHGIALKWSYYKENQDDYL